YVKSGGVLHAFDAQSGTEIWSRSFGQDPWNHPVATQGQLYAGTARFDEETGALLWHTTVEGVNSYLEDVTGGAVYVTTGCENGAGLAPADGTVEWFRHGTQCGSGPPSESVLYGGRLYAHENPGAGATQTILDSSTGTAVGTYKSDIAPAFAGNLAYFLNASV